MALAIGRSPRATAFFLELVVILPWVLCPVLGPSVSLASDPVTDSAAPAASNTTPPAATSAQNPDHALSPAAPRLYVARYRVRYRGLSGGVIEFALRRGSEAGRYVYESRAFPSMLGRLIISKDSREKSLLAIDADGVRPLAFTSEDGTSATKKDTTLNFDWGSHRLTGRSEDRDVDLPLPERTQDHLSIQIAVMVDLLRDRAPGTYPLVDNGAVKDYEYARDGEEKLTFNGKQYDCIILRSERAGGSRRSNRYWHAPALNDLPLRAERSDKGDVDLTLELEDLKLGD